MPRPRKSDIRQIAIKYHKAHDTEWEKDRLKHFGGQPCKQNEEDVKGDRAKQGRHKH